MYEYVYIICIFPYCMWISIYTIYNMKITEKILDEYC